VALLCCLARFEGKEGYMTFMNSFVEEHTPEMRKFLDQLSVSCFSVELVSIRRISYIFHTSVFSVWCIFSDLTLGCWKGVWPVKEPVPVIPKGYLWVTQTQHGVTWGKEDWLGENCIVLV